MAKLNYLMYGLENVDTSALESTSSHSSDHIPLLTFEQRTETGFILIINNRRYYSMKRVYNKDGEVEYLIGNNRIYECVTLRIGSRQAVLQKVQTSPHCGEGGDYDEDKRDTVDMVMGLLHYAINDSRELLRSCGDRILLTDNSHIGNAQVKYKNKPLPSVVLSDYMKLTSNQTWYEQKFGAVPDPLDIHTAGCLADYDKLYDRYDASKEAFEGFWESTRHSIFKKYHGLFYKRSIWALWKRGGTWQDLMQRLKQRYDGPAFFCVYMSRILRCIGLLSLEGTSWSIPVSNIEERVERLPIESVPRQIGGSHKGFRKWKAHMSRFVRCG